MADVTADIDRTPRDAHPDLGAHEFVAPAGSSPKDISARRLELGR